jgi:hypothetical protein
MSHLEAIGDAWALDGNPGPATVGVFLDGENPWEHFPDSGRDFLEGLYRALEADPDVETVTLAAATADAAGPPIPRIHSGSWIESSFRIWMGHEEDRRAWAALGKARAALARAEEVGSRPAEALGRARRLLYAAEGSDWFWWYGDDFETELALEFDALFRNLVIKACELIGEPPPAEATAPIKRVGLPAAAALGPLREPTLLLTPSIDGRETNYFEWQGAGLFRPGRAQGAMFGGAQAFKALHFGFDLQAFYLRLDPTESPQRTAELCTAVRVTVAAGDRVRQVEFPVLPDGVTRAGRIAGLELGKAACARLLELALPFEPLGLTPATRVGLAVDVLRGEVEVERLPQIGFLGFTVPDEDFERVHWRV